MLLQSTRFGQTSEESKQPTFARAVAGFSYALDLAEGNSEGHSLRTCILGMKLGQRAGLSASELSDLFYALLLKDLGTNRESVITQQVRAKCGLEAAFVWRHGGTGVPLRKSIGASHALYRASLFKGSALLNEKAAARKRRSSRRAAFASERALRLGLPRATANAIANVDAHWDGRGVPALSGLAIPTPAQIIKLAQTLEILHELYGNEGAIETLYSRCKGWFDPGLIAAAMLIFHTEDRWKELRQSNLSQYVITLLPENTPSDTERSSLDSLCEVFSEIADGRSNHTSGHASGVAKFAVRIGEVLGLNRPELHTLRRAALLHDIGNLGVSPAILDKPAALSEEEKQIVQAAPLAGFSVLSKIPGFEEVAEAVAAHRERMDGSGSPFGLHGHAIGLLSRILAVAEVTESLAVTRSYREKLSHEEICAAVDALTPNILDNNCVQALRSPEVMALVA